MIPTVDICTNGINISPGHDESWTDRYVTWLHLHTDRRGEKFEYFARTISRRWFSNQQKRAEKLARLISRYVAAGFHINLVGHSNGCDVLIRALELLPELENRPVIEDLHLFNAACESNMEKNGLNAQLNTAKIWRVFVYVGGSDLPMALANITPWGYGSLGATGPENISPMVPHGHVWGGQAPGAQLRLVTREFPAFHHSTFFDEPNFESTMRTISQTTNVIPQLVSQ